MIDPIVLNGAGDFDLADLRRFADQLAAAVRDEPAGRRTVYLAEPGEPIRRMSIAEAASMLRDAGLSPLARRVERLLVPPTHIGVLSLCDVRPPTLRLLPRAALPSTPHVPEPPCAPSLGILARVP